MANSERRTERRSDALSKDLIVQAATEILDQAGEVALTFRVLAKRLRTGSGAIYWHVANKQDLLSAATEAVVTDAITGIEAGPDPREAIRQIALRVFDALEDHPWVGTHLASEPWQAAALQILEHVGRQLQALGLPDDRQFDAASALLDYIVGLAAQHAAAARLITAETSREAFLSSIAARLQRLDPEQHSFMRRVATQLEGHDDRRQFTAGVDIYVAGIAAQIPSIAPEPPGGY